jgi:hypothetical protein
MQYGFFADDLLGPIKLLCTAESIFGVKQLFGSKTYKIPVIRT